MTLVFQQPDSDILKVGEASIVAFWQLPSIFFIQLKSVNEVRRFYLMFFRSKLGEEKFVSLITMIGGYEGKVKNE